MSKFYPFRNPYESLIDLLIQSPQNKKKFMNKLASCGGLLYEDEKEELELIRLMGVPLVENEDYFLLSTLQTPFKNQRFCFVDIESNGGDPTKHQVIEIGAILYESGKIIDHFESFVFCQYIPESITEITGIHLDDVVDAPNLSTVMQSFRKFLGDAVFVAHNVSFDYRFLNAMFYQSSLGWLCNRYLCTINLARKTIPSVRYSLSHLNEFLEINTPVIHRAYADALTSLRIFEYALKNIPEHIITTENLIAFTTMNDPVFPTLEILQNL
ncbi:hypothetical protein CCZ01_05400 [Helicobacter monodelphidis]|uniref:3'-5' exonuclease n=1 Tax=Helicobacter sp. 15-1451 TaxID=2004995 RepID=UPI000DCD420F|nr:3'-5' exonuclease [Helicobacter sp. 15-1451]RAX57580.1 hypothetical protein CCZ01_05400 [Helicobacter sp. 15-1451]